MPTVRMLRNHGPYKAGHNVNVSQVDADYLIETGRATEASDEPARNAKREDWARYVASLGYPVSDDDTREALIERAHPTTAPVVTDIPPHAPEEG